MVQKTKFLVTRCQLMSKIDTMTNAPPSLPPSLPPLPDQIKAKAHELGFSTVGIIPAAPARHLAAYERWIAAEMHGAMGYMARPDRIIRRQDLNVILPNVQTIICVGLDYYTHALPPELANDPSRGRISRYAWGVDYHDIMWPRMKEFAAWLEKTAGGDSRTYVDTGAILERDHAESAGMGFTGKNAMLIQPRRGSFMFLGELLTTISLPDESPSPPQAHRPIGSCGSCTRCQTACPTDAFPEPYIVDARRCISYLTIELKGWMPRDMRPLIDNWIYGCDVCQEVCPYNRFAQPTGERGFYPAGDMESGIEDWAAPSLLDILAMDEAAFAARFANSPIKRIKRRRLLRNAAVAAGNWGNKEAIPLLINLLDDSDPILRGHAAWALGQIGDDGGLTAVSHHLPHEKDETVREEYAMAIAHS